jgi:uncharacterized protein (DUF433 family)
LYLTFDPQAGTLMELAIIDRGRGPEIAGSRITVYDVLAETQAGATPEELAQWYQLDIAQIRLALEYIDQHREEVLRDYEAIRARHARGNPPAIQERLRHSRARLEAARQALSPLTSRPGTP